jgi:Protein kinase domain/Domain of unknown function (DUF4388)
MSALPVQLDGFSGELRGTPLVALLRRLQRTRQTGTLWLSRNGQDRWFFFENGQLRAARSSREEHRIGRSLVLWGYLSEQDLGRALAFQKEEVGLRLDQILVDKGLVPRSVLNVEAKRLMEQIVSSALSWPDGSFRFQPGTEPGYEDIAFSLSVPEMALAPGSWLGPYEILARLSVGGMGEVWKARDSRLGREVAIKVLPARLSRDAATLARFEQEAKAVAALSHPNILAIHDFATHDDITYAVMELLEGETLPNRLDAGPVSQKEAVDHALQLARGLSAAHERGVIHRDLKPENLFVTKDGHVKILDFGLAKRVEATVPGEEMNALTVSQHTEPGMVMGTPGYMSPEQLCGLPIDHRTDIFSLGTILYEMLSGNRAFQKETAADTMAATLKEEPPDLSKSGRNILLALDHIVRHCLEKDRDDRFQSAKDIAFTLAEQPAPTVMSGAQIAEARTGTMRILIAAAVLVALTTAGIFLLRHSHKGMGEARGVKRVAVLLFENPGVSEDDDFADGIRAAVRGKLTAVRGLEVMAPASPIAYKTTKTPKQKFFVLAALSRHWLVDCNV